MESDSQRWANVAKMGAGIFDTLSEANDELALKKYSTEMLNNPDFVPDMNSKDFNVKAYNKAKTTALAQQLQSEQVKKARFEAWKNDSEKSRIIATDLFSKAQAFTDDEDLPKSFKYYEQAFEAVNTGTDIEIDKDGLGFTEKDHRTGKTEHMKFKSQRDMVAHFQQYGQALKDPKAFAMNHINTAEQIAVDNMKRIDAGEEVFDDKGNRAVKITGLLDPKTGKPRGAVYDINGKQVEEADIKGHTFRTLKSRESEAGIGVKEADTQEKKAAAQKHLADAKKAGNEVAEKNLSSEEKLARGIARIYQVSEKDALDYVLKNKTTDDKLSIVAKMLTEDEDLKTSDPIVQNRIKELGLESVFSKEPVSKQVAGKGIGDKKEAQSAAEKINVKYPAAQHKGKKATINGVAFQSDGTKWVEVK